MWRGVTGSKVLLTLMRFCPPAHLHFLNDDPDDGNKQQCVSLIIILFYILHTCCSNFLTSLFFFPPPYTLDVGEVVPVTSTLLLTCTSCNGERQPPESLSASHPTLCMSEKFSPTTVTAFSAIAHFIY